MRTSQSFMIYVGLIVSMIMVSMISLLELPLIIMVNLKTLQAMLLFGFSLAHGLRTIGKKPITAFLTISVIVTYLMEWLGTHIGIPFGHYYYTNRLGPLLMDVPIIIPLQWFNMLYICYIMGSIILAKNDGLTEILEAKEEGVKKRKSVFNEIIGLSITVGLLMIAWDLINDPFLIGVEIWIWTEPLEFFGLVYHGIPISNFIGWFITSSVIVTLFESYRLKQDVGMKLEHNDSITILVVAAYMSVYLVQALSGIILGIFLLDSFTGWGPLLLGGAAMGFAAFITYMRHFHRNALVG